MANYYWVGPSGGIWDSSNTAPWSLTQGGAGGAGVPGPGDTANTYGYILLSDGQCQKCTFNNSQIDLISNGASIQFLDFGNFGDFNCGSNNITTTISTTSKNGTFNAGNSTSTILLSGTYTNFYLTATVRYGNLNVNGSVGGFSSAMDLYYINNGGTINYTIPSGSIDFNIRSANITDANSVLNITKASGGGTLSIGSTYGSRQVSFGGTINLSFDPAYSSSITLNNSYNGNGYFKIGKLVFPSLSGSGVTSNYWTLQTSGGSYDVTIGNLVIPESNAPYNRYRFQNFPNGLNITSANIYDTDFYNVRSTIPFSGTRLGDVGNNSGIIFDNPRTYYWNRSANSTWRDSGWSLTATGAPEGGYYPLPQDNVIFTNTNPPAGNSITTDTSIFAFPSIDFTSRTNAITFGPTGSGVNYISGNLKLSSAVSFWPAGGQTLMFTKSNGTQTIISAGKSFNSPISIIGNSNTTVILGDAFTSTSSLTLTSGTLNTSNYAITTASFTSTSSSVRTLNQGTSFWTITGSGTAWNCTSTNFTYNGYTINMNSPLSKTFAGGGLTYGTLFLANTGALTISGSNIFYEIGAINYGPPPDFFPIGPQTLTLTAGTTQTILFYPGNLSGYDSSNTLTINSTGSSAALSFTYPDIFTGRYLRLQDTQAIGKATAFPGDSCTIINNVSGWAYDTNKRYWVGGDGLWSGASNPSRWSSTSGGVTNATAPTWANDVYFDNLSNTASYNVTVSPLASCNNLYILPPSGNSVTLGTSSNTLSIYGGLYVGSSNVNLNYTGTINLLAQESGYVIRTNNANMLCNLSFSGVGGGWTFASDFKNTPSGNISISSGTVNFASYNISTSNIQTSGSNTKTLNLSSSIVTLSSNTPFLIGGSNVNIIPGTSTINVSSNNPTFNLSNAYVLYDVNFTGNTISTASISGNISFHNLTFAGKVSNNISTVILSGNNQLSGTLTISPPSMSGNSRYFIRSDTYATPRRLTANTFNLTDVDFRDIINTGTTWTGTRLGDAGGNQGITFDAPKTVYWNLAGSQVWSSNAWAITQTGTPDSNNFPLPQDTAIFTDTNPAASSIITVNDNYNIPGIDFSARSAALTFNTSTLSLYYHGSLSTRKSITQNGSGTIFLANRSNNATIIINASTQNLPYVILSKDKTVVLGGAFSTSNTITHLHGTLDTNSYSLSCLSLNSIGSNTRTLNLNSSTITVTGTGTTWNCSGTGLTINSNTSNIFMYAASFNSPRTFAGGGFTYYNIKNGVNLSAPGILTITGNNTFNNISSSATNAGTGSLLLEAGSTNTFNEFNLLYHTIQSTVTNSTAYIIKPQYIITSCNYLTLRDISATPPTIWYAGPNSTNSGNVAGWTFADPPPKSCFNTFFPL